jgi:hypothetical protein
MMLAVLLWILVPQDSPEAALRELRSWDPDRRIPATQALGRLRDAGKMDLLVPFLNEDRLGSQAAHALAMMGPRNLVRRIAHFLPGATLNLRCVSVIALGGIGGDEAREALIEDLKRTQTDPGETIWALGQVGRPEDAALLIPFLRKSDRGVEALSMAELSARGEAGRKAVLESLEASKSLGSRIALLRLGRATPKEEVALLEELLRPIDLRTGETPRECLSFGPFGIALERALEAVHGWDGFRSFEEEIVLEKPLGSIEDLRELLQSRGFTLDVAPANLSGLVPSGIRTTLRRVCDWMLDGNVEPEDLGQLTRVHERRVVLQGSTVKLLRLRRQSEYWKARLEGK